MSSKENLTVDDIIKVAFQCLLGLQHMNTLGLVHRHLSPDNILINTSGNVQLYNFGLYYMTDSGKNVSFPIGFVLMQLSILNNITDTVYLYLFVDIQNILHLKYF